MRCCSSIVVVIIVPSDSFVGEDVAGVNFSAVLVYFRAVDAGCAGPGLEVQTDAGQVGEFVWAPGTFDVLSDMHRRIEVLVRIVLVKKDYRRFCKIDLI